MNDLFDLTTKEIKFEEAMEFFDGKIPLTPNEFYALADEYRSLSFTVSGYSKIQVLKKFHDELLKAIENGTTMQEFKQQMNQFLEIRGYEGVSNFQADNIFRTNIQTAYQVGHYKQMTQPTVMKLRPYWQYDAVNDTHTRPSHLAMDGKVFRADDPIWDVWYPPNGFRCRCGVKSLSENQVKDLGLNVENSVPERIETKTGEIVSIMPDENFSHNAAKMSFVPDVKDYPQALKEAYEQREKSNENRKH